MRLQSFLSFSSFSLNNLHQDVFSSCPAEQVSPHLRVQRETRAMLRQHQGLEVLLGLHLLLCQPEVPRRHRRVRFGSNPGDYLYTQKY